MTNFATVTAVTENMETALNKQGLRLLPEICDDARAVPASLLPVGQIYYTGETFECKSGQRPSYSEASFVVRVLLGGSDRQAVNREGQSWVHKAREALTVEALNAGSLADARPVSRVSFTGAEAVNRGGMSKINCRITVRYREA